MDKQAMVTSAKNTNIFYGHALFYILFHGINKWYDA